MTKTKDIILAVSGVEYNSKEHTYNYQGRPLQGITTTLVNRAYPKDETYAGVSDEVLTHAAERGKACHAAVGTLYTIGLQTDGYEAVASEAHRLLSEAKLSPLRFEYIVTDFEHYASPIDIVCVNAKNEICIVDMKFTSRLLSPQVTLQTSIYRRFFTLVNPWLTARHLYVLHIHTNDAHEVLSSGLYELQPVSDEFLDDLIRADLADSPFSIEKYYGTLPAAVNKVEDYLVSLQTLVKEKTDELNAIKDGLTRLMLENNVKQYATARIQLTAVTPAPRTTFDATRFRDDNPALYRQYLKQSEVKPSVRITIK